MGNGWGCQGERERREHRGHWKVELARLSDWVTQVGPLGWNRNLRGLVEVTEYPRKEQGLLKGKELSSVVMYWV